MQDILTDLDHKPVLASVFKRWVACLIDLTLAILIMSFIAVIFGKRVIATDGSRGGWTLGRTGGNLAIVLSWLVFLPGIEAINNGQTIGKMLFRLRTVRQDGSKLTPGISLLKHLFDIIDYLPLGGIIGMCVSGSTRKQQRVGDLVAKTIVVEVKRK